VRRKSEGGGASATYQMEILLHVADRWLDIFWDYLSFASAKAYLCRRQLVQTPGDDREGGEDTESDARVRCADPRRSRARLVKIIVLYRRTLYRLAPFRAK